jgi:hypothetical protein
MYAVLHYAPSLKHVITSRLVCVSLVVSLNIIQFVFVVICCSVSATEREKASLYYDRVCSALVPVGACTHNEVTALIICCGLGTECFFMILNVGIATRRGLHAERLLRCVYTISNINTFVIVTTYGRVL